MKIVGIAGVARCGKDSFAEALIKVINDNCPHFNAKRYAFADKLKSELDPFFIEKFGFSCTDMPDEKKEIMRPMLVAYGVVQRSLSNNLYWRENLREQLEIEQPDVAIISDLRYAYGDNSEAEWIKNSGGKIVHIKRYDLENKGKTKPKWCKIYKKPASEDEKKQEPYLEKVADFKVDWKTFDDKDYVKAAYEYAHKFFLKEINYFLN